MEKTRNAEGKRSTHVWSFAATNKGGSLFLGHFHELLHLFILIKQRKTLSSRQTHSFNAEFDHFLSSSKNTYEILTTKDLAVIPGSHSRVVPIGSLFLEDQRS